ncbi:hypothetical protein [Microbacterium sp. 1.5R]|uniref:hypothetical protein n=1 Tax=Microbacterium sp. 1.5R TaxID=1916917 RepID=UPI0011A5FA02|nr:hypothetical protein [Microbacterium sp. 1.5R]
MFSLPLLRTGAATEQHAAGPAAPTVLVASRPPRFRVDFVDQLVGDDSEGRAPKDVVLEFRTDPFRSDGVDVIHVSDVTAVLGSDGAPERRQVRRAKRFVKMLRRRRLALVLTVGAAGGTGISTQAEDLIRAAATTITSPTPPLPAGRERVLTIGHSHLRDRFLGFPRGDQVAGRLLVTALASLHPSARTVLNVFGIAELPEWTLRLSGGVPVEETDAYAHALADHAGAVSLRDEMLSDAETILEVSRAEVVIVPAATTLEAQTIIMLALSQERPVLIEDSDYAEALANEVGSAWVRRHTGPLTAAALEAALAAFRADPPEGRPDLDARAPNAVSARYHAVYHDAAAAR